MAKSDVLGTQKKYKLDPIELVCISAYIHTSDKTFSWSNSVGRESKSKNQSVLAGQWFRQERIQKYLFDRNIKEEYQDNTGQDSSDSNSIKDSGSKKNKDTKITSDNIQDLLEREYNKTVNPEKRVDLLMKVAEFIGAKKTTEDSANLPVIYLPARCKECSFRSK